MIIATKKYSKFGLVTFEEVKRPRALAGCIRRNILQDVKANDYYKYDGRVFCTIEEAIARTWADNINAE